jgi:hypothetical protein
MSQQPRQRDLERLAFIRYLFVSAVEESKKPAPLAGKAVLTFHDSIELFMQLVSEQPGVQGAKPRMNFDDYWKMQPASGQLHRLNLMGKLNSLRVGLKHHGIQPSKADIEDLRSFTELFLEENTQSVFGLDFASISLTHLVHEDKIRDRLIEAEKHIGNQKFGEALGEIAVAFEEFVSLYGSQRLDLIRGAMLSSHMESQVNIRSPHSVIGSSKPNPALYDALDNQFSAVSDAFEEVYDVLKFLALGVDFGQYSKFERLTPFVTTYFDGNNPRGFAYHVEHSGTAQPSLEDCLYCFDFVIENVLRAQAIS